MSLIENRTEQLESYSGLYAETARVFYPADLDELRWVFAYARKRKCRVTLRGGGHSFDSQSLGHDVVVSMMRFDKIEVLKDQGKVRVGAGATWRSILAAVKPHGMVPAGTVTTSDATAAGTLAANCLSRFSPRYGNEAAWVERFSFLTVDGNLLECSRPTAGVPDTGWTPEQRVFMAAIGGFGYLGAIVEITYKLLSLGKPDIRMLTRIVKHTTFQGLASDLVPAARSASSPELHPDDPTWDAISAGLYPLGNRPSSMLFFSKFTTTSRRRRPLALYQPSNPMHVVAEWLMRGPLLCKWLSAAFFHLTGNNSTYVDDLDDFMFFMDADTTAKRIGRCFGKNLQAVQQTFVVPVDLAHPGSTQAEDQLTKWLIRAHDLFVGRNLTPTLQDVLFLPGDLPFRLSPNPERQSFAVSYAFETSNADTIARAQGAFTELADVLWNEFGGRVSLVKNVEVNPATLESMYGNGAQEFFALKRKLDPDRLLRNEFLERVFPALMRSAQCR